MITRVSVSKGGSETASSLARRFTKRVQGSGVLKKARSIRYSKRPKSQFLKKKNALRRILKNDKRERLIKLGKLDEYRSKKFK